jgi:hypothetical protein
MVTSLFGLFGKRGGFVGEWSKKTGGLQWRIVFTRMQAALYNG